MVDNILRLAAAVVVVVALADILVLAVLAEMVVIMVTDLELLVRHLLMVAVAAVAVATIMTAQQAEVLVYSEQEPEAPVALLAVGHQT
jgi:hypothetical protein